MININEKNISECLQAFAEGMNHIETCHFNYSRLYGEFSDNELNEIKKLLENTYGYKICWEKISEGKNIGLEPYVRFITRAVDKIVIVKE